MPRNRSEKGPRILAEREVTPIHTDARRLVLKVDGEGRYSVWVGGNGRSFHRLDARDKLEAEQVYDWFYADFYYRDVPSWDSGRWELARNAP